jgi:hypothetical protein
VEANLHPYPAPLCTPSSTGIATFVGISECEFSTVRGRARETTPSSGQSLRVGKTPGRTLKEWGKAIRHYHFFSSVGGGGGGGSGDRYFAGTILPSGWRYPMPYVCNAVRK